MDIFESALSCFGLDLHFNHDNLIRLDVVFDDREDEVMSLIIYRNTQDVSLAISILTHSILPEKIPDALCERIIRLSLEPLRNNPGVGIYPDSRRIAIYQIVPLSDKPEGYLRAVIDRLVNEVHKWDREILKEYLNQTV